MTSEEMKAFAEMLAKAIKDDTEDKKTKRETILKDDTPEVKAEKQMRNRQKDLNEARSNKAANERLRLETQLNLSLNERQSAMENLVKLEDSLNSLQEQKKATNKDNIEAIMILDEEIAKTKALIDSKKGLLEAGKKQTEAQREARRMGESAFAGIAGSIGLAKKAQDTYLGKLLKMINLFKEGGGKSFFKGLAQGLLNLPMALIDSIIKTTIDMIFALDDAQNAFSKVTAQGDKYNKAIQSARFRNIEFGISADQTSKSMSAMYNGFFEFTQISVEAAENLGIMASRLEFLGVSTDQTAKILNFFNKNLGQTSEEAAKSTAEVLMMGQNVGISQQRMARDLLMALPKLTVYGNRARDIFRNLAAMAQRSGSSMQEMLNVAGKFDTFQSAAETVGKLNSILGTQMSATEMLMMTEDQRIETLILQVQASGIAFRDMDRFTQKAIAAAAGINDMNEAQRIFGGSLSSYREAQAVMAQEAEAQKRVDDAVKASLPARQRLLIFFNKLVSEFITESFLQKIHQILDAMMKFNDPVEALEALGAKLGITGDALDGLLYKVLGLYAGIRIGIALLPALGIGLFRLVGSFGRLILKTAASTTATVANNRANKMAGIQLGMARKQHKLIGKQKKLTTKLTKAETAQINANTAAQKVNNQGMGFAALKIAAIGAALLMAGYGIKAAAEGIASLAKEMKGMGLEAIALVGIVGILAGAFIGFVFAVKKAALSLMLIPSTVLLALGASMFLLGAGIGVAAYGMAQLAAGMKDMSGGTAAAMAASIGIVAAAMYGFVAALTSMSLAAGMALPAAPVILAIGAAVALVGAGIGLAAFGMSFLAESLTNISTEGVQALMVFTGMVLGMSLIALGLVKISAGTATLGATALASAPGLKIFALAIGAIGLVLAGVGFVFKMMFDSMTKYAKASAEARKGTRELSGEVGGLALKLGGMMLTLPALHALTALESAKKGPTISQTINVDSSAVDQMDNIPQKMATISERIRSVLAEAAESINQMATNFQNVGVAMEAVAEGIERVDTSMGRGQKRVEIVSTLENLAKVATAEVGTASFQAQTAQTAQAQEAMNITLKNTFPEGMNLVIKDVGTLKTYIDARIDAKKVGRAGQ